VRKERASAENRRFEDFENVVFADFFSKKLDHLPRYTAIKEKFPETGDFGGYAMNSFRIEKGIRLFSSDITLDHSAIEGGLGRFCKVTFHRALCHAASQDLFDPPPP